MFHFQWWVRTSEVEYCQPSQGLSCESSPKSYPIVKSNFSHENFFFGFRIDINESKAFTCEFIGS